MRARGRSANRQNSTVATWFLFTSFFLQLLISKTEKEQGRLSFCVSTAPPTHICTYRLVYTACRVWVS